MMPPFTDLTGLFGIASAIVIIGLRLLGITKIANKQRFALVLGLFAFLLIPFGSLPLAAYVRGATGDLSVTTLVLLWLGLYHSFYPQGLNVTLVSGNRTAGKEADTKGLVGRRLTPMQGPSWWGDKSGRNALLSLVSLAALLLYPLALGAGMIDPYRIGYGHPLFVLALQLIALLAWFKRYSLITLCIALVLFAWAIGWSESDNLWDYLIDPFVSFYALWVVGKQWLFRLRRIE